MTETASGGDGRDLVLAELEGLAGEGDERSDVRPEEVLAVAEPDDQRRVEAGADDGVGRVLVDREQGERALAACGRPRAWPR